MKEGFRQSQAWLHTWSGLIMGWLLFMIFVTGTLSFFRDEITHWMQPELQTMTGQQNQHMLLEHAINQLSYRGKEANFWIINMPTERNPTLKINWFGKQRGSLLLDPNTGKSIKPRASVGGNFYYHMHYQLWYISPFTGRIIVSLVTLFMLIALITGIIIHKKIFKDFFVFRANNGQRSWLDGHNVTAVLALPFHLMITFSGLIILIGFFMPWANKVIYDKQRGKIFQEAFNMPNFSQRPSGVQQPVPSLTSLVNKFTATYPHSTVDRVLIYLPEQTNSQIMLTAYSVNTVNPKGLIFDSQGMLISKVAPTGPVAAIQKTLDSLHRGNYANYGLRWLYFLSGLAGCFMIASGLILWSVKRQARLQKAKTYKISFGQRLVQILNTTTIAGLCVATPSLLLANRLLPDTLPHRQQWEVRCFFISWGLTFIYSIVRSYHKAWIELFAAAAMTCIAIPIVNFLTTSNSLFKSILATNWQLAGVELVTISFGLLFTWLSYKISAHRHYLPLHKKTSTFQQQLTLDN